MMILGRVMQLQVWHLGVDAGFGLGGHAETGPVGPVQDRLIGDTVSRLILVCTMGSSNE